MVDDSWRKLVTARFHELYLPVGVDFVMLPVSIAARAMRAGEGDTFLNMMQRMVSGAVESDSNRYFNYVRWVSDTPGTGELDGITSRIIGYGVGISDPDVELARYGVHFRASLAFVADADPDLVESTTGLVDAAIATMRWIW